MKSVQKTPGAERLIESLRALGYDFDTAVADLIDNSIVEDATQVGVEIHAADQSAPAYVAISDDGRGMDSSELEEAMRFGSEQSYASSDLGKYGLGLKTASLSQCRVLTVASKPLRADNRKSKLTIARWDIDHVSKARDWSLLLPDLSELDEWERALISPIETTNGTIILWSGLEEAIPQLSSEDDREKGKVLARLLKDLKQHLRMVFHRFMQGRVPGRRKLTIAVAGEALIPWDPFCAEEKKTQSLPLKNYPVIIERGGAAGAHHEVTVYPYILPKDDEFSSKERWKDAAGPKGWNAQQGLYFYRNGRLLQAGGWSWLRKPDEHTKLLRIAIDFPPGLDDLFAVNITKMRARVPNQILEGFEKDTTGWVTKAKSCYDRRSSEESPVPESVGSVRPFVASETAVEKSPVAGRQTPQPAAPFAGTELKTSNRTIFDEPSKDAPYVRLLCRELLGLVESFISGKANRDGIPIEQIRKAVTVATE